MLDDITGDSDDNLFTHLTSMEIILMVILAAVTVLVILALLGPAIGTINHNIVSGAI